jgi:deoxyribonuclease-4
MPRTFDRLLFGTAGVLPDVKSASTLDGIRRNAELGFDAMELEFVQGVRMKPAMADDVKKLATDLGIRLTVHAPYYINLNSKEPDKYEASIQRILDSCTIGNLAGAESVAFHPAFIMGDDRRDAMGRTLKAMRGIIDTLAAEKNPIWLRPELTGKESALGSLDEIIELSLSLPRVLPCIDFAHLHARTGGAFNTRAEWEGMLDTMEKRLGRVRGVETMHIHLAGISYTAKGEREHMPLAESDLDYKTLMAVLRERGAKGFLICESPHEIMADDVRRIRAAYEGKPMPRRKKVAK